MVEIPSGEVVPVPARGEEAILYSSRNKVDLLVSDYRLPGMSGVVVPVPARGIELMRVVVPVPARGKVQKNQPQAKIILVTGQTDPKIRVVVPVPARGKEVAEAGADAFFIKPVPMADFLDAVERHLNFVETILPPEPIAADDTEIQRGLPDLLAGLRQELAATAVLLLNDTGRILARAGDLAGGLGHDNEVALISSLLSIRSAGLKVSRLIGQKIASNRTIFEGGKYDLVFAPVGLTHAMLAIGKGIAGEDQDLKTVDIFSAARKNIEQVIGETAQGTSATQEPLTTPLPRARTGTTEVVEQSMKELAPLFKDAKKKLKPAEVNEFWNKAADKHKAPSKPDMLSYEQAKQLGLGPPEGDES
ncbi:MAG: response regulator [Candidatus Atribacteria bacterium]|nr:response regulator [Candidatus Atribacteria bacterium]